MKFPHKKSVLSFLCILLIIANMLPGCAFGSKDAQNNTEASIQESLSAQGSDASEKPLSQEELAKIQTDFDKFTNELLKDELSDSALSMHFIVKNPSQYGITDYDRILGDYDFDTLGSTKELADTLNKLSTFNYTHLTEDQQLTYDILKSTVTDSLSYSDLYLYGSELSPYNGTNAILPIMFSEYSFYSKTDVDDYLALVKDSKRYFEQIIQYEGLRSKEGLFFSDSITDAIIESCESFIEENSKDSSFLISTFDERIDAADFLTDAEKSSYKAANKSAVLEEFVPSYQVLIDGLRALKGTGKNEGGLCGFPEGKRYYEYLIQQDFGWDKSLVEINNLLDQYIASALYKASAIIGEDPSLEDKFEEFSFTQSDVKLCLEDLKKKMANDFPEIPQVNYDVKNIDESLRDNFSAAMYLISPIDNYKENSIYINPAQLDAASLYSTLAHEGYPGHMYQSTYFSSTNPAPVRSLFRNGGYMEGWGLYAELYSYNLDDKSANDKLFELMRCNQIVTTAIYAKMDIGVNYEGWDENYLSTFLKGWGVINSNDEAAQAAIKEVYQYLIAEPASYPKYAAGCFAIMEWRNTAERTLGSKYNVKEFHKFLLDLGPAPFSIIDDRFDKWLKQQAS